MEKFLDVLPTVIMILSLVASVILFIGQRWGSAIYWFSAAMLNFSVIFLIRRFG